ncbi:MAG: type II toxin-antitoxin system RelE/ParE family toxin [Gammaproteobacteria bacterium]
MTWEITFYDEKLQNELLQLPVGLLAKFLHYLERIEIHGANLGMPHTRAMGDGLFELRIKAEEGISRIFYCTIKCKKVVLLHHFIKKSNKTPAKDLKLAKIRLVEVKNANS